MLRRRESLALDQLTQMQRYLGEETVEEYQDGLMTRRAMLKRLLFICGSSAAAAVLLEACGAATPAAVPTPHTISPISASGAPHAARGPLTVSATDPAVATTMVTFQSATPVSGYLARPRAAGTYPGIIVVHENRGLTDHIKDVARRLAKAGYIALVPDLVSREGGTGRLTPDMIAGVLAKAKPTDLVADLNAGVRFLGKVPGVKTGKAGVVGFCFGGGYALRLAATNPLISAAVSYYGVTPQPASQMQATHAAILGQYGGKDTRVDSTIPALENVLQGSGKTFAKHIYPGAGHAFNNDTGPSYNETAAVAAWKATLGWFATYLKR